MKKFNLLSKSKFVLIAMLVVIVVGATLFGIFGFNNSPGVGTGYQVSIKTEINFPGNSDKIKEVADEVLSYENYYIAFEYHSEQIFETKNKVSAETIETLKAKYKNSELGGEISKCIGYGNDQEVRKYVSILQNQNNIANLLDSFRATLVEMYLKNNPDDKLLNQYK